MGSFRKQKSPGRYIDEIKYENLKILAKHIIEDNTFLAVYYSSTYEVGAGKTTSASQDAECYTELVNQMHGTNLTFTMKNLVFKPQDLIKRAHELPKYSCILLDEWEDAHYLSELGKALRQFFRKCRQLNLFIIVIIPNFFQLPPSYAMSRSVYAVDIRYEGEFERGYFRFYNFERKRELYLKGKKTQNYNVVMCNFSGRFTAGYAVDEKEYREAKLLDMLQQEKEPIGKDFKAILFRRVYEYINKELKIKVSVKEIAEIIFEVTEKTGFVWLKDTKEPQKEEISLGNGGFPLPKPTTI